MLLQVRQQGVYSRLHRYLLTEGLFVHKNSGGDSNNRLGVSRNERREIDVDHHDKRRHADLLQVLLYIYFNLEKTLRPGGATH